MKEKQNSIIQKNSSTEEKTDNFAQKKNIDNKFIENHHFILLFGLFGVLLFFTKIS